MKLPDIVQQPVGEFASGNIRQPNHQAVGKAGQRVIESLAQVGVAIANEKLVGDVDESTGAAALELSELRAELVNNNTLDADFVGDDVLAELQIAVSDGVGGRREITKPKIFTHEVAEELWAKRSKEIVDSYAANITNRKAKEKFVGEMYERYVAPGASAVMGANIVRSRAFGQARAERAIEEVLASNAPTETRESNAREIIARQVLLGADPIWAENKLNDLGPMVDQIDVQNQIMGARTADQIDQIEEDMWAEGSRMSPQQQRTMSGIMDQRRRDFKIDYQERQTATADEMFVKYAGGELTVPEVAAAVGTDQITREAGFTFLNGLTRGSTVKASDPFMLSRMRGEISRLQYVGNNMRMTDKAKLLRLMITRGSMGLTPQGMPTGQSATISGEDVFRLNKDIDTALSAALKNDEYDGALKAVYAWTNVMLDFSGQITTAFDGDQATVEAAIAFKLALDNYMDSYGVDAKPSEFFEANKDAYDLNKFIRGADAAFMTAVPQSGQFMTIDSVTNRPSEFNTVQQQNFILWLSDANLPTPEHNAAITLFDQYYRNKGIAPNNGALMLEPDDPLYRQFQSMIPDNE